MKITLFTSLLLLSVIPCQISAQVLFPCSPTIQDDYGVCTHITRKGWDFDIRDRELDLTQDVGLNWVRSDLDFGTYFGSLNDEDPRIFDQVLNSCESHNTDLLGILTWFGKWPWQDPDYNKYVEKLAHRYDGRIRYWESINEVNLFKQKEHLVEDYLSTLKTTYETLKRVNPENQVLLSGLGEVTTEFLPDLSRLGGYKYFDVMNFHSYFAPEALIPSFHRIDSIMKHDGWRKPVWFTECGMHTAQNTHSSLGFFQDLLPHALSRININEKRVCVGILRDDVSGYDALTDEETDLYIRPYCKRVQNVSFSELSQISVRKVPVLIASKNEYFPALKFSILVDYIHRGGTIVLCGGMPFYYDAHNEAGTYYNRIELGTSLYKQLHMSPQNSWNDIKTGEKLSETPSVVRLCEDADFSYHWDFSINSPARYLSTANLHKGDSLISLIKAGTENCQGTVAGIYKLNSDLKGNIIFQTRMYSMQLPNREAEQARRVARIYLLAFSHGISKVFWYNLRSREKDSSYSEDCFGLIHADFSEKPAMQAYRTLVGMCPPGSTRPELNQEGVIYRCCWKRTDGKQITALWTADRNVKYSVGRFRGTIYDHLGTLIKPKHNTVLLNGRVLYLVE